MSDRPRIGISACLLGERVRYDGGDKRDRWIAEVLGRQVDWVPVCPEVEAGLGTPRDPMNLARALNGRMVLVTNRIRDDLTATMTRFSARRAEALADDNLDGYVFKAGSPSCGLAVPVDAATIDAEHAAHAEHGSPRPAGSAGSGLTVPGTAPGLFAEAITRRLPDLPVADERQLADPEARDRFVARVVAHHRGRKINR